jgi:ABC-type dipeptide/oligopeptide/nickel transport system permease subunit
MTMRGTLSQQEVGPTTATLAALVPASRSSQGIGTEVLRELRRNPLARFGTLFILLVSVLAIAAPLIAPYPPYEQDLLDRFEPPSREHLMGTDEVGRDTFSRILYGARISLSIAMVSTLTGVAVGSLLGLVSGYFGGRIDEIIMRCLDILYAFPGVLLAVLIVSIIGPGIANLVLVLVIWGAPTLARIVRGSVLSLKEQDFISAAHALGAGAPRIMFRHLFLNCMAPIIVYASLGVAGAILTAASLGFLGLGVQPPTPEWGAMLGAERNQVFTAPHLVLFPGIAIMLTVLGFNLLGDGLRDALDPRLAQVGIKLK